MKKANLFDVLIRPIATEKATNLAEIGKYVFEVAVDSTSAQIKAAMEQAFSVKVKKVNVINVEGKRKVFKGRRGKRSDYKKAIITLEKGEAVDISVGVK